MKKYTKWYPLGNFSYGGKEYITLVKKNKKTGMLKFKTKRVNGWFFDAGYTHTFLPSNLIDVQKSWDDIICL